MKKLAYILVGTGLLLTAISTWADSLGLGGDRGTGGTQILGFLAGILFILFGFGSMVVAGGEGASVWERVRHIDMREVSILFWVVGTFVVAYIFFFLVPVFFSAAQIQYLTKYIPNGFITHVGFDVEAIVTRVEDWLTTGLSPYADGFIAYPPFTLVVFAALSILGYPAYFKWMVGCTVLAYLVVALILPWVMIPKQRRSLLMLFFVSGLFSYGLQFEQERGQFNLITFAFTLLAIYIFHFHPKIRFFAYLLFTLAIQLKVYPVFFIVMFVDDWRAWRDIVKRFVGLGLVNVSLLFILGYRFFLDFIRAISQYQLLASSRVENLSIKGFVHYLSNDVFGNTSSFPSAGLIEMILWVLLGSCFLAVIRHAIHHKSRGLNPYLLVVCTIAALIIPSVSIDYKLSLLTAPLMLVFCALPELQHFRRKSVSTLLVILASLAYWITLYPATVKPEFLSRNFPALVFILASVTVLNFLAPHLVDGTIQTTNTPAEVEP